MLKETITRILGFTKTLQGYDFNEAVTKHFVVLPILRDLGWNCDNLENLEVFPDKSTESGPVDYALQHDGKARVFIVVKRWPTEPAPDELYDEIAPYVSQEEVDFVVLTNGKTWDCYLPNLPDVPWETRRFCSIDLDNGDEAASDFQKYLSKPYVVNGSAKKAAEAIVKEITPEKPDSREQLLRKVREIIREIEDKASGGDYIFRGEPECYPKVSSTLYRQYEEILTDRFNVENLQNEMRIAAKEHLPGTTSDFETPVRRLGAAIGIPSEPDYGFETLTELQHYGGKTNLIDFTTDSRVALFFACDGSPSKNGRVICLKKGDIKELVENPREPINPLNRVIAQKSIFVRPRRGFVEFDQDKDVVVIPVVLKKPMLDYLQKYHNISAKTVYNDLHGFIRIQDIHHQAYEALYRGLSAEDKGELDKAIQNYDKAIELKPDFFGAYNNRGVTYREKHDFDKAIQNYDKAIEIKPDYADAYNNRGVAYVEKHDFDKAIQNYDKAVEINPRLAEAYNNRGNAYVKKRDFDTAIQDLTTTIEIKPDYAEAYCNRGIAYGEKRDFDKAIQDYDKAIEIKPDYAEAYNNRGVAYVEKGDFDTAIQDLTTAIEIKPDYAEAYNNRGIAYGEKRDFDTAIQDLTTTIEIKPDYAEAYNNRGNAYVGKRDFDTAIQDYGKAIEIKPDYADAYYNRGITYGEKRDFDTAIQDFTTTIEIKPDYAEAYNNRGIAYLEKRDFDTAIKDFTTTIEIEPDSADAYCNRGEARMHLGKWDKAKADLTVAKAMGLDIIASFQNDYENVADFEQKNGVQVPPDIAEMLTRR